MKPLPTMKHVARAAGVSIKTVSRVINDASYVSKDTRRRVTRAIQHLNYRPNALARSLVTRRSQTVGLVIADIANPYFPPLVRSVEDAAIARNYSVILCNTDENATRERIAISLLLERQADGLILGASRIPARYLRSLANAGAFFVLVNRLLVHARVKCIVLDDVEGARQATTHLIRLGHRRIAYLEGPDGSFSNRGRLEGYRRGLDSAAIKFDPALVRGGPSSIKAGREALASLLDLRRPPSAVVAFDDVMAIGALQEVRRRRLRVGADIAIVGFDDIDMAALMDPPLTTMTFPIREMGQLATNYLLDMIEGKRTDAPRTTTFVPQLIVRESCGSPKLQHRAGSSADS